MLVFVGLGNPGPKYRFTRHNIGFMLIDALADALGADFRSEHKAEVAKVKDPESGNDILLVKPQTFMNLSGESVQSILSFYKLQKEQLLVIHDEVDVPFGQLRLQHNRGHGGHNGIRNIHQLVGPEYARLRLGVGRPTIPQMDVATYVLQNFSEDEMSGMSDFLSKSAEAAFLFSDLGFQKAQNKVNAL